MTDAGDEPGPGPPRAPATTASRARRFIERSTFEWHQQFELAAGVTTPGRHVMWWMLETAQLPSDLRGLSVIDIGTTNGAVAFEAERRGARRVVAVDVVDEHVFGFAPIRDFLGSRVEFLQCNVYDLAASVDERFDLVIFWGVLYHLRHPLLALDNVRAVTGGRLSIETAVADAELGCEAPAARFYRRDELGGDATNWFAPTVGCLHDWLSSSGFSVERVRAWPEPAPTRALMDASAATGAPEFARISGEVPLHEPRGAAR